MVRGVTDDFWATFVDPEPTDPSKRQMTVWGQGAVNVNTANALTLYALVCSGAPTADVCTDPTQMQLFVMGVTMGQALTMGVPLFGSSGRLHRDHEGQGHPRTDALGPGDEAGQEFQSESEFAKSITTESKVFSIYAVGVVKGYKRETRVSVHAVVDFRQAPSLADLASSVLKAAGASSSSSSSSSSSVQIRTASRARFSRASAASSFTSTSR